jgi:protein-S-isoprenylcysteine O-methyltransferase Ste14
LPADSGKAAQAAGTAAAMSDSIPRAAGSATATVAAPSRRTNVTDSWAFRHRGLMGAACLVPAALAAIFGTPTVADTGAAAWLLDLLGWTLFLGYVSMRVWATLYIGGRKDKRLATTGPYSITRNPLYLGGLCFALSAACFLKSIWVIALTIVAVWIYFRWVIAAEEEVLEGIFGQAFVVYKQTTPRVIPRFSNYQAGPTVEINVHSVRTEAQRLWVASLMPFIGLHAAEIRHAISVLMLRLQ